MRDQFQSIFLVPSNFVGDRTAGTRQDLKKKKKKKVRVNFSHLKRLGNQLASFAQTRQFLTNLSPKSEKTSKKDIEHCGRMKVIRVIYIAT